MVMKSEARESTHPQPNSTRSLRCADADDDYDDAAKREANGGQSAAVFVFIRSSAGDW